MATKKLIKPIKRQLLSTEQYGKNRGKAIIVELLPGDEISFRTKGSHKTQSVYLGHCYKLAQILAIESEYKVKLEEYNNKKKIGQVARRPKRPSMPFNKMYFDAIRK
jgi:hypothetical protein